MMVITVHHSLYEIVPRDLLGKCFGWLCGSDDIEDDAAMHQLIGWLLHETRSEQKKSKANSTDNECTWTSLLIKLQ